MAIRHSPPENEGNISDLVAALKQTKGGGIDAVSLLNALTAQWGGAEALARDIATEFRNAAAGGIARQRILQMLVSLINNVTEKEYAKPRSPSDMSDDELAAAAMGLLGKFKPNGQPSTEAPQQAGHAEPKAGGDPPDVVEGQDDWLYADEAAD